MRQLDLPSFTGIAGDSAARRFNQDAVWEISSNMMQTFYSRPATCDYLGSLDQGITYSLHALLLCEDLAGLLRHMWKGFAVDEDNLGLELARRVGPLGNYLAEQHTAKHCRSQAWGSRYFGAKIPLSEDGQPDRDLLERIDNDLRQILKKHRPDALDDDVLQEMRAIQERFAANFDN
jgi:trimethylamine:corrinoid methyltransferase-like protein